MPINGGSLEAELQIDTWKHSFNKHCLFLIGLRFYKCDVAEMMRLPRAANGDATIVLCASSRYKRNLVGESQL